MSDCDHDWDMSEFSFDDAYFVCKKCRLKQSAWERHEAAQADIAALREQVRWVPVVAGYVDKNDIKDMRDNKPFCCMGVALRPQDAEYKYPIYIDPPLQEQDNE